MAESAESKKESRTAPKRSARKVDLATMAGIALALAGILGGLVLEKGSIWDDMVQGTAAMIVLGGTFGAVLVTTPLPIFKRALKRLGSVLFEQAGGTSGTIDDLIRYAAEARKNGIVSLEAEAGAIPDPFFRKALCLAVDGTDMQEIRKMMEIDINLSEQSAEAEAKVWEAAGGYAPTVGIIGAVMGLIQVMKHLEDIQAVGHGIAVAFVATVYGVGSANLFFLPASNKLRARMSEAVMLKEMILDGVIGIVEGHNPTLIRMKLEAFDLHPVKSGRARPASTTASERTATAPVAR